MTQTTVDQSKSSQAISDVESILAAWQTATERLRETHEALRAEVKRLTDELELKNQQLARKNRLADLGQLAAHVAHEVRNNLVPMTLYVSVLRRHIACNDAACQVLDKIESGLGALQHLVSDLLQFTAGRQPQPSWFPLADLLEEIRESLAPQLAAQRVEWICRVPEGTHVLADRDMLQRAVANLVLNAIDAMPDGGQLQLAASPGDGRLCLSVSDTGSGISDEARERLFEPFFTTKTSGTGLGLAIVQRLIDAHGGTIRANNRPSRGATFVIELPQPDQESQA